MVAGLQPDDDLAFEVDRFQNRQRRLQRQLLCIGQRVRVDRLEARLQIVDLDDHAVADRLVAQRLRLFQQRVEVVDFALQRVSNSVIKFCNWPSAPFKSLSRFASGRLLSWLTSPPSAACTLVLQRLVDVRIDELVDAGKRLLDLLPQLPDIQLGERGLRLAQHLVDDTLHVFGGHRFDALANPLQERLDRLFDLADGRTQHGVADGTVQHLHAGPQVVGIEDHQQPRQQVVDHRLQQPHHIVGRRDHADVEGVEQSRHRS